MRDGRGEALPPGVGPDDCVVLFDGVCNLCSAWVTFAVKRDPAARLRFAALQSDAGQAILRWAGLPTEDFRTMAFLEKGRLHVRSAAVLRALGYLKWPWRWLKVGLAVPAFVRDWFYDRVALNRYRLFGTRDECLMPTPDLRRRFLDGVTAP